MNDFETWIDRTGQLEGEVRRWWLGGAAEDDLAALIVALELAGDYDGPELRQARLALREALSGPGAAR